MKYRTKPRTVEAIQYRPHENCKQVAKLTGQAYSAIGCKGSAKDLPFGVNTPAGYREAKPGDWVVRANDGKLSVCTPAEFSKLYEVKP